jgi:hypothetical protein
MGWEAMGSAVIDGTVAAADWSSGGVVASGAKDGAEEVTSGLGGGGIIGSGWLEFVGCWFGSI